MIKLKPILILFLCLSGINSIAQENNKLELVDIFNIENVSDPQISPDGNKILYVRNYKDIMKDRGYSNIWMVNFDGSQNRPLTTGNQNDFSPRWSPDGKKIIYKSNRDESTQIYMRWLDSGAETKLTNVNRSPGSFSWSPDGQWIAFTMFVPSQKKQLASLSGKPEGAKWNDPAIFIDDMTYRADGRGYLKQGANQIFLLSIDGGTPRKITDTKNNTGSPEWSKDGKSIIFSANLHEDSDYDSRNSEVYEVSINGGEVKALTDRQGPDSSPRVSPDGSKIAYLGYDDKYLGYQINKLYVMNRDGSGSKLLSGDFDRSIGNINWSGDGKGIYFQYNDFGNTKIGYINMSGKTSEVASGVGGLSLGRPYAAGSYSIAASGNFAFTHGGSDHPSDLGAGSQKSGTRRLTDLNRDLFSFKKIGKVEEIMFKSSFDDKDVQGWICYPPDFDPSKKYPLLLEIHGGPFAAYGPWFSTEVQLYAAAGYVVLYTNPRGSTSYGQDFGNLIHHNYPGQDYDDLMSGVDAVIAKGFIDEDNLFVTGGSGGGVLTAWIVGNTDRFKAAVVAKPVINWYSFVLYSDGASFHKYWFPGVPWENQEQYMKRSPISLVGNVKTPTLLLTGEADFRTPIAESEQYYRALKLQKVETGLVRIPGASHGIAARPSNLMAKVANILAWFDRYK